MNEMSFGIIGLIVGLFMAGFVGLMVHVDDSKQIEKMKREIIIKNLGGYDKCNGNFYIGVKHESSCNNR